MGQPVEERAGETLGPEGLGPFVEGQIAGDQGGAALVTLRDQLEQQLRSGLGVDLHFNLGLWHSARESYTPIETQGRGVSIGV